MKDETLEKLVKDLGKDKVDHLLLENLMILIAKANKYDLIVDAITN